MPEVTEYVWAGVECRADAHGARPGVDGWNDTGAVSVDGYGRARSRLLERRVQATQEDTMKTKKPATDTAAPVRTPKLRRYSHLIRCMPNVTSLLAALKEAAPYAAPWPLWGALRVLAPEETERAIGLTRQIDPSEGWDDVIDAAAEPTQNERFLAAEVREILSPVPEAGAIALRAELDERSPS